MHTFIPSDYLYLLGRYSLWRAVLRKRLPTLVLKMLNCQYICTPSGYTCRVYSLFALCKKVLTETTCCGGNFALGKDIHVHENCVWSICILYWLSWTFKDGVVKTPSNVFWGNWQHGSLIITYTNSIAWLYNPRQEFFSTSSTLLIESSLLTSQAEQKHQSQSSINHLLTVFAN